MRAILIDPETKTVSLIDHPGTLQELYRTLHCSVVESVALTEDEALWCDEEGLLTDDPGPFFQINDNTPISGRALVLGLDKEGDLAPTRLPLERLAAVVSFPDIQLVGWHELDGSETMETPFGTMPVFGSQPIFIPRPAKTDDAP